MKKILPIVATLVILAYILFAVKSCNTPVDPIKSRLEEMNDSLLNVVLKNSVKIDSLYSKIDSLSSISDTIITKQSIVNEYYRQEVYNILNADAASTNRKLAEVLKVSDSLLKSGFYSRTINIPNEPD
jgi:hypothetical protein